MKAIISLSPTNTPPCNGVYSLQGVKDVTMINHLKTVKGVHHWAQTHIAKHRQPYRIQFFKDNHAYGEAYQTDFRILDKVTSMQAYAY
jgi:hypothetical protein